jgi:hypothetical protein
MVMHSTQQRGELDSKPGCIQIFTDFRLFPTVPPEATPTARGARLHAATGGALGLQCFFVVD